MYKLTTELLTAIQATHQILDKAPNIVIEIFKKDGKGGYDMKMPYPVGKDVREINVSINNKTGANECTVSLNNSDARYSPDYDRNKTFRGVTSPLPLSIFKDVILPKNLVHVYMGYGKYTARKFTGYISNPQINEEEQTIQFSLRDEYSILQKPVDPVDYQSLIYRDARASFIISDLFKRAGVTQYVIDTSSVEEKDFTIQEYAVDIGTNYDAAIKKLLDIMSHTMKADRFGIIHVSEVITPDTSLRPDVELSDYINVTSGQFYLDDNVIRNKIIVKGRDKWKAYRDNFLLEYLNGEEIVMAIDVPWAESEDEMKAAANFYFMQMRRMFRSITVECIANPCIDCGDTASLEAWVSAATSKYTITSIETTMNAGEYKDKIELEHIINEINVAEECEGEYAPYRLEVHEDGEETESEDEIGEELSIQERVVNTAKKYLNTPYQADGNKYLNKDDYGLDASSFIFACLNTRGLLSQLTPLDKLMQMGTEVTEDNLMQSDLVFFINENGNPGNAGIYVGDGYVIGMLNGSPDITTEGKARAYMARCMKSSIQGGTAYRRLF